MAFETKKKKIPRIEEPQMSERVTEDAFLSSVQDGILEGLLDSLEEAGFTGEEAEAFREELSKLSVREASAVLSIPFELKQTRLPILCKKVHAGEDVATIVRQLADEGMQRGFTLGYHMSNSDILQKKGKNGATAWSIDGREQDHRDNDLPMAYYSTTLSNLYAAKRARFLYIVRAETGSDTTHKQDNNGAWGRATKLDIVEKFDHERLMAAARKRANGLADEK